MLPRINNSPKKQEGAPKDENIRKEARLEEDLKSVQPMGNQGALLDLREVNDDNMLDLSGIDDLEEVEVPYNKEDKKPLEASGSIDLNNSMYLNSSHNIVNTDWLDRVKNDKEKKERGGEAPKKEKKPDQADVQEAIEIAEEIVQNADQQKAPEQAAPQEEEKFAPLSTYDLEEDLRAEYGGKKKGKKKKSAADLNQIPNSKVAGMDVIGDKDARWKADAEKRIKKVTMESGPEATAAFHAEEMEKLDLQCPEAW